MTFNNDSWIEGTPGEHMIATNTKDNGKTWSEFVPIAAYSDNNTHGECSRRPSSLGLSCVVTPISCSVRVRVSNPPLSVTDTPTPALCAGSSSYGSVTARPGAQSFAHHGNRCSRWTVMS